MNNKAKEKLSKLNHRCMDLLIFIQRVYREMEDNPEFIYNEVEIKFLEDSADRIEYITKEIRFK